MSEISKPDYTHLWSSGGAIVAPSNVKIQTGWTAEVPPFQWENWSQNRQDQAIAHILQKGISVWSSTGEYYFTASGERSYVQGSDGQIYVALQDSNGQNPVLDTSEVYWAALFKTGLAVISTSTTWTVPSILKSGIKKAKVTVISGGGGAGKGTTSSQGGGGGGGGAKAVKVLDLTGVSTVTVAVGNGGAGTSTTGGSGNAGGTSTFGAFMTCTGGLGGSGVGGGESGGVSGTATGGDINEGLGDGSDAVGTVSQGDGGGPGSRAGAGASFPGAQTGRGYGGGGGGCTSAASTSGAGRQGIVIVEW